MPRGPAVFDWSARQRQDLETLWRDPASDGARERLAKDLAAFCGELGWAPDAKLLEEAAQHGDDYLLTLSAVPCELYFLPWEVIQVGAGGTYLSDFASAQVRYSMPGLEPREIQTEPATAGVLFAWSSAGGAVPHEEQAAAIRAAAEAGGVSFRELAEVNERSLQEALDAGPPSVLHLLCHGSPGPEGEPARLTWGASDNPSEITGPRMARMLRAHENAIRLVVLSACGSGDGHGDPMFMASFAQELHRTGIHSVVASRYPLSVRGSQGMTRALYDKMLREAWSLERALRHTRQTLLRVDDAGEAHAGDAYGIQLYAHDTEWFVSDNDVEAERPVLASYPFGSAARPVPASAPPSAELALRLEGDPGLSTDELVDRLRKVAEDQGLILVVRSAKGRRATSLIVRTTVDGAQRLLGAWRSKALQVAVGVVVAALVLTSGLRTALGGTIATVTGKVATVGQVATASGGTTATIAAFAGKAAAVKIAAAAVIGSATAVGVAAVYRAEPDPPARVQVVASKEESPPGPGSLPLTPDPPAIAPSPEPPAAPATAPGASESPTAMAQPPGPSQPGAPSASATPPTTQAPGAASPTTLPSTRQPGAPAYPPTVQGQQPGAPAYPPTMQGQQPGAPAYPPTVQGQQPGASPHVPTTAPVQPNAAASQPSPTTEPPSTPPPGTSGAAPTSTPGAPGSEPTSAPGTPPPAATAPPPSTADAVASDPQSEQHIAARSGERAADTAEHADARSEQCGNGVAESGEQCDDGNARDDDGCSSKCKTEVARPPVAVEPSVLHGHQNAGNTDVAPSKETRAAMRRNRVKSLRGTVRLCVDVKGVVVQSEMEASTGYLDYDRKLVAAVRGWRYRPIQVNGQPAAVCSTVDFMYAAE